MKICDLNDCTGCSACANACPVHAITMKKNNEGFLYPHVDEKKCIKCNLCQRTCPMNKFDFNNTETPKCFAVMANDDLRKNSSSGAFFPVLATYVINNGGVVCGAVFDDNMQLHHDFAETVDDLEKMKGSKYLQSKIGDAYSRIKEFLESGRLVLFTGTPCQCAGLHNFLNKQYDNLIIADLICHGVPSQSVYDNYLQSEFAGQKVLNTNFRDKKDGWGNGFITTTTITTTNVRSLHDEEDSYMQAFFANISLRNSCYHCKFARMPRASDFTMADFWGISKEMDDHKGTSCILLNTPLAEQVFDKIKSSFKKIKEYPSAFAVSCQPHLKHSVAKHPARKDFFSDLGKMSLRENIEHNICSKKNVALLNFSCGNENFGALLTSVALNMYVNSIGYNAQNIDYFRNQPWIIEQPDNPFFDAFRDKYLPRTKRYNFGNNLSDLNEYFQTFVVGSDQVFRQHLTRGEEEVFLLSFANPDKKIMSYAASFGTDNLDAMDEESKQKYKHFLSLFDAISVRESSGVDICHNMGLSAIQVIDPVFLIERQKWIDIANTSGLKQTQNEIIYYTINEQLEQDIENFIVKHKQKLKYNSVRNITYNTSVEEWLCRIKDCKLFVTDSFHGVCFAIIFNVPFVCINPNIMTSPRMKSLLDLLKIDGHLYSSFDDVDVTKLPDIKYDIINATIDQERKKSADFLQRELASGTTRQQIKESEIAEYNKVLFTKLIQKLPHLRYKYRLYKILSKITIGKLHRKFKQKRISYHDRYYHIKQAIEKLGVTK